MQPISKIVLEIEKKSHVEVTCGKEEANGNEDERVSRVNEVRSLVLSLFFM